MHHISDILKHINKLINIIRKRTGVLLILNARRLTIFEGPLQDRTGPRHGAPDPRLFLGGPGPGPGAGPSPQKHKKMIRDGPRTTILSID